VCSRKKNDEKYVYQGRSEIKDIARIFFKKHPAFAEGLNKTVIEKLQL